MQKITPFLWFDNNAEEAVNFYTSVFKDSKIKNTACYSESGSEVSGMKKGSVMTISFEINGQEFVALNGGPVFKINSAISFVINCKDQKEVDYYWDKLTSNGGKEVQCGWLEDKFGVSWQVVPIGFGELMSKLDPKKSEKVMKAMFQMKKLDINKLKEASK